MQPTAVLPTEQQVRESLDAIAVFNLLTDQRFFETVEGCLPPHRERRYPPTETLAMFVRQALADDGSCQAAVDERITWCVQHKMSPPSASTAAYCEARQRLPEDFIERLATLVGNTVSEQAESRWRWRDRRVLLVDGTGFSMPDTKKNQAEFPQPASQAEGCGFPLGRLRALSCAATGAIVDATISAGKGKASGEQTQLRVLARSLKPNDVLVGDAINENYWCFAMLATLGIDGVFELNGSRCLVPGKHRSHLMLSRPRRPSWMSREDYASVPETITVRKTISRKKGFRDKILLSTFVDDSVVTDDEICALYAARWSIETDFRSLKCALHTGILGCRTPEMVRKELRVHLLAYNLVRLLMSDAAKVAGCEPRQISFCQALKVWRSWLERGTPLDAYGLGQLLERIAKPRVRNRPGRCEPRAIKRRGKPRSLLDLPRKLARQYWYSYER